MDKIVIRIAKLIPPPPVDQVAAHAAKMAAIVEVRRALNLWAYSR